MSFIECMKNNAAKGIFKDMLRFDRKLKELKELKDELARGGLDEAEAEEQAAEILKGMTERELQLKKVQAASTLRVAERMLRDFRTSKDYGATMVDIFDAAKSMNYVSHVNTINGESQRIMQDLIETYGNKLLGRKTEGLDTLTRALHGEATGDAAADAIAQAWKQYETWIIAKMQRAGSAIIGLKNYVPHMHSQMRIMKAGVAEWSKTIEPLLDWEKMGQNRGRMFNDLEKQIALIDVHKTLSTDGLSKIEPKFGQSGSSLADRQGQHRFLIFKDYASYKKYHAEFGEGTMFDALAGHMSNMAHEVAMLDVFGPNPNATKEWLKGIVNKQAADLDYAAGTTKHAERAAKRGVEFDRIFGLITGADAVLRNTILATGAGALRNLVGSALMGSAVFPAVPSDVYTRFHWKMLSRLPLARIGGGYLKTLVTTNKGNQQAAVAAGFLFESAVALNVATLRHLGGISGPSWTRVIYDKVIRSSLLNKWTEGVRWIHGLEFSGMLANQAKNSFDQIDPYLRKMFEQYQITPQMWDALRKVDAVEMGGMKLLRPNDLRDGSAVGDALADKFMGMIFTERDNAIMTSSLRARAALRGEAKSGTVAGEILNSVAFLKNFPVTLMQLHQRRALELPTVAGRLAYASTLIAGLTVSYALGMQARQISQFKDPLPMWGENGWKTWGASLIGGGGLGIYGDFMFGNTNRFGNSFAQSLMGPTWDVAGSGWNLARGNAAEAAMGEDTNFGREGVNFLRRWVPGSNLWWARGVVQRLVFDNLAKMADPEAYHRFDQQVRRNQTQYNQGFWWRPGSNMPQRLPDMGNLVGNPSP